MHTRKLEELKQRNEDVPQDGSPTLTQLLENPKVLQQIDDIEKLLTTTRQTVLDMPSFDLGIPEMNQKKQPKKPKQQEDQSKLVPQQVFTRRSKRHQEAQKQEATTEVLPKDSPIRIISPRKTKNAS